MTAWHDFCVFLIGSFILCITWAASTSNSITEGRDSNVVYIGGVDGKQYFAIKTLMNWTDAETYCNDSNMKLGTANTVNQINLWKEAYNNETFYARHWTAGRDVGNLTQFVWNHGDLPIDSTVVELYEFPFLTYCLSCDSYLPIQKFHAVTCDHKYYVICEI